MQNSKEIHTVSRMAELLDAQNVFTPPTEELTKGEM